MIAAWWDREVIRVSGPDANPFLQGQLSQDLGRLQAGESAWSLLLQPQGKVDAFLRVTRVADDDFLLDVDSGWSGPTIERLGRFKLRTKADIEPLDWKCLAFRGDGIPAIEGDVVARCDWPGFEGVDLLGPDPVVPGGADLADPSVLDRMRIAAGFPRMGRELDERTIPAEAGLVEATVSFTKGCYTGQELVARIDSRGGNVPRHLRRITIDGGPVPPAGAVVVVAGKEVGALTSVAATDAGAIALGYAGRAVDVPADAELRWDGGQVGARVEALGPSTLAP
jgi:folate-binding protein YgfZ